MASTQCITDLDSAITTGPSATSVTNATNPANKMGDITGNLKLAKLKLQEASTLLTLVVGVLDSGDGIKTTVQGVIDSLD